MKEYFLDCEMLKENHKDAGEVISIGIVDNTDRTFYSLIQPKKPNTMPQWLMFLTGINDSMLEVAPNFFDVISQASDFCFDGDVIYTFGGADIASLTKSFYINDEVYHFDDVFKKKYYAFRKKITNIMTLPDFCNIDTMASQAELYRELFGVEQIEQHNALSDANALRKICNEVNRRKNIERISLKDDFIL